MKAVKYQVKPGSKADLASRNPDCRDGTPDSKEGRHERMKELAADLDAGQRVLFAAHKAKVLIILQGMDASGKDGTIRNVLTQVNPMGVRAYSFKEPVGAEKEHDFLWRYHRVVPGNGEIAVFNRSQYEEVLIVRYLESMTACQLETRYDHIRNFEKLLAETGTTIIKCFLHISKDEQKARLQERLDNPKKHWKFSPDDVSARKQWDFYMNAYEEAITATSTSWAPWHIIPANSKSTRDVIIASIIAEHIQNLHLEYPEPKVSVEGVVLE